MSGGRQGQHCAYVMEDRDRSHFAYVRVSYFWFFARDSQCHVKVLGRWHVKILEDVSQILIISIKLHLYSKKNERCISWFSISWMHGNCVNQSTSSCVSRLVVDSKVCAPQEARFFPLPEKYRGFSCARGEKQTTKEWCARGEKQTTKEVFHHTDTHI